MKNRKMKTLECNNKCERVYWENLFFIVLVFGVFIGTSLASCSDEDNGGLPSRLFRPIAFTASVSENKVGLSWVPINGATYLLEISRDSLLFETELVSYPLGKVAYWGIEDLWSNTRYSARIKSVSADPNVADSEYQEITFVTQTENIFYIVDNQDIGTDWVLLHWLESKNVSHITIFAEDASEVTLNISDEEKTVGEKQIAGLKPNTKYTFRIYLGEMLRGTTSVITK